MGTTETFCKKVFGSDASGTKLTISAWFKISDSMANNRRGERYIITSTDAATATSTLGYEIYHNTNSRKTRFYWSETGMYFFPGDTSVGMQMDASGWYHVVLKRDSTQGTDTERLKMYINGVSVGQLNNISTWPAQDSTTQFFKSGTNASNNSASAGNYIHNVNAYYSGYSTTYGMEGGYIADLHVCNGYAYDASSFGSFDANGIWTANSSPSVSYGTNGWRMKFNETGASADANGFGADSSGNGNHFATDNLGTNPSVTDTPDNNFATMNPNSIFPSTVPIIRDGNLQSKSESTSGAAFCSTIGVQAGKWYVEAKIGSSATLEVGAVDIGTEAFVKSGTATNSVGYDYGGNIRVNNSNVQTSLATYTGGDIIGICLDMDTATGTVTFYKNGSIVGSAQNFTTRKPLFAAFYMQSHTSSGSQFVDWNFGNPTFTISSSNSDANGYGSFEYAVLSGHYALCTKNLATYG